MHRIIPAVAVAFGLAVSASAQDRTVRSTTEVSVDDGRTITLTGCLEQGAGSTFTLRGGGAVSSDDVTKKSKVRTDVEDDGNETKTRSRTEIEHNGDAPLAATYVLTPQQGVDLASQVGKRVHIIAVAVDPDEDDAEVEIKDRTKIERDGAPDVNLKSRKRTEVSRGDPGSVTVVAVKPLGGACSR